MSKPLKTTCPRDCYDACGIHAVTDPSGRLRLVGDPEHHIAKGKLCGKCALAYNGAWQNPRMRLQHPLKRTGPKGSGQFEPVTWDAALSDIAGQLRDTLDRDMAQRILHTHYTGTVAMISGWFPIRFFNAIGATEVDPDTVCNKAGHTALEFMFGTSLDGFDPEALADAKCIAVWGANPSHSAPHMHEDWLRNSSARRLVIDPVGHGTAQEADMHLQLRPGTDAALAFAFMHIAQRDGLLDMDFIAEKTLGFEEIEPEIRTADPVWAERVTGVPSGQIEEAAHLYCQGPSLLWLGQGLQRTTFGGNAFRSLATLAATTGNLIGQGCGLTYMNGPNTRGVDMDYLTADHLRDGPAPHLSHLDMPDRLLDPGQSEALFCWNNNILASSPRQSDLRDALQRKDLLHVCVDLFHTDTTQYADYVLPAASFLEFDDLVIPYFHHTLSAQKQVAPQFGEALPNQEIFRRLARSLGLEALELYEDDATMLNTLVAQTPFEGDFSDLAKIGTARLLTAPREQFGGEGIPTPSGRVEIASSSAENDGLPRTPFAHADAAAQDSKLRILSPASKWLMNSSYGNDERIRQRLGRQQIIVHPTDCSQRALEDGDEVLVHNDTGELRAVVCISETVQPGVAVIYKGSWPKHTGGKNVNVLNPGRKSDIAESSAVHSIEAHVARVSQSA